MLQGVSHAVTAVGERGHAAGRAVARADRPRRHLEIPGRGTEDGAPAQRRRRRPGFWRNNGLPPTAPTATVEPENWARAVAVNLTGDTPDPRRPGRDDQARLRPHRQRLQRHRRRSRRHSGPERLRGPPRPPWRPTLSAWPPSCRNRRHRQHHAFRPGRHRHASLDPGPATRPDRRRTARPVRGDARCGSDGFARPTSRVIADLIIGDTTGQIAGADNPATISG